MNFEDDLINFKQSILAKKSENEIRKEYLHLLKKYHPDLAADEDKNTCKEYTTQLLLLYEDYKNNKTPVTPLYSDNSIYVKLMKIAREEYNEYKKYELKTRWQIDENSRDYLGNAIRCYEKVIKECNDPELIKSAKTQLQWIRPFYNLQNKDLINRELQKIIAKRNKENVKVN